MRFIALYLLIFFITSSCNFIDPTNKTIDELIPSNTSLIIRVDNPNKFKSDIINNSASLKIINQVDGFDFKNQIEIINKLSDENPILICLSDQKENRSFTIITRKGNLDLDIKNETIYNKIVDSIYVISNSLNQIEKAELRRNDLYEKFKKLDSQDATFSIFATNSFSTNFFKSVFGNEFNDFKNNLFLNINLFNDKILINGISQINDSTTISSSFLKNTSSKNNSIARVVPDNFNNFYTISLNNPNTEEIGFIEINGEKVIVTRSNNLNAASLKEYKTLSNYKGKDIYQINDKETINELFGPLPLKDELGKTVIIDQYFIHSKSLKSIKEIIDDYVLGNTYKNNENYNESSDFLSEESSFYINSKNASLINISKLIGLNSPLDKFNDSKFQIINEEEIFHINGIIDNDNNKNSNNKVSTIFSTKIQGKILKDPHFVTNHITKAREIAVQDENYNLYLISNQGKVLWKKKLAGKILGQIKQVDLYKNGRLQLIFVTENRLYVLDRNGKEVKPYPKIFKDKITQPLAVYDYDNNKNYRFLITQGKELLMYDRKGKIVRGFKYDESNEIIKSPKHFRIKNKDIITVITKSGLKIINRRGKVRIKTKDNIKLSDNDIFRYNNNLVGISEKGNLFQIDMNGSVSNRKLSLSNNAKMYSNYNIIGIIDENKLSNHNKSIDLPFGNYSKPKIFSYNKIKYISIFDNQTKKVYLFDENLNLFDNFPIYSNSNIDLDNIDKDNKLEMVLLDDESSIRAYKIRD